MKNPSVEEVTLIDKASSAIRRPLTLINGEAYATTWLPVRVKVADSQKRETERTERRLFVLRKDGRLFDDKGRLFNSDQSEKLGLEIHLSDTPPLNKLLSKKAVDRYQEGSRPDPTSVFARLVDIVDCFIDFERSLSNQRTMCELIGCYILSTWFLDAFTVIGILWPNGDRGCGKTQLLAVVAELSYLGQVILAGGSYATLRDLADYGATLAFDDAENLTDPRRSDPDKRALLLAGNRKGVTVSVKEPGPDNKWRTRYINAYCPRLFSAIRLPDPILESRTVIIPLVRTGDRKKANSDPLDYTLWPCNRGELIDDLWLLAVDHLPELPKYERVVNERASLQGRNLEPWRAILAIAAWLEDRGVKGLWERMEKLSTNYQAERSDLSTGDLPILVLKALRNRASRATKASSASEKVYPPFFEITTKEVKETCFEIARDEDMDVSFLSNERVGRALAQFRFNQLPRPGGKGSRKWKIDLNELQRLLVAYGIDPLLFTGTTGTTGTLAQDVTAHSVPNENIQALCEETSQTRRMIEDAFRNGRELCHDEAREWASRRDRYGWLAIKGMENDLDHWESGDVVELGKLIERYISNCKEMRQHYRQRCTN